MIRKNKILIILMIFIIIVFLIRLIPNLSNDYIKSGKLYINEVMANNYKTISDDYGEYSDYIEIYNSSNKIINLKGYHLSDSEYDTDKWTFDNIVINPKEYLLVYASKRNTCNIETNICHTNFKLSSKGETITLTDKNNNIISKITYPSLSQDISYGYKNGEYIVFESPTPKKENNSNKLTNKVNDYSLEITEYMTHNTSYNYEENGNYYDWIEIHNNGSKKIEVDNLYISDNIDNLYKFKLPSFTMDIDEYKIIYFTNDNIDYTNNIYVDFGLSDNDEYIIISSGDKIIDKIEIVPLLDNISYGKVGNEFKYFTAPTPGYSNNTAYFDRIGGNNGDN